MDTYGYTREYLTRNGKPWFPMMGEIHYSRVPQAEWKEELLKMKAGGIDLVSTYCFWLHHEEVENEYDFTGARDLKKFVQVLSECGLKLVLRVGPWCHGEARNGGFPDWLLHKGMDLRSDDEQYLSYVRRYFEQIYAQVEGMFLKDGGPIIAMQIENEYGHVGGYQGEKGETHMRTLLKMVKEIGFEVPIYTATGWGGAVLGDCIPVMGGYCDAPWDASLEQLAPNVNYVFTHERNDANIGSDHGHGWTLSFDPTKYPYLTAELGGGLQVTEHRRPLVSGGDIGAMSLSKLGCGVNLLGYYMYHGGTNPDGKLSTLEESKATGYANNLPILSYDFQAPVKEYGDQSESYGEIKLLAMFIKDFGEELCKMNTYLLKGNPEDPANLQDLRMSVRRNEKQGYLFVNNYQRGYQMADHLEQTIEIPMGHEVVKITNFDVKNGAYGFYPINMPIGDAVLSYALATPLCILKREIPVYVFYSERENPRFVWKDGEPSSARVITITRQQALHANKVAGNDGKEYLVITQGYVLEDDMEYVIKKDQESEILILPADSCGISIDGYEQKQNSEQMMTFYNKTDVTECEIPDITDSVKTNDTMTVMVNIDYSRLKTDDMDNVFLELDVACDKAELFIGDKMVSDWFYTGKIWRVGLKRFQYPGKLKLVLHALTKDQKVYLEKWPVMDGNQVCKLVSVKLNVEKKYALHIK